MSECAHPWSEVRIFEDDDGYGERTETTLIGCDACGAILEDRNYGEPVNQDDDPCLIEWAKKHGHYREREPRIPSAVERHVLEAHARAIFAAIDDSPMLSEIIRKRWQP